MRITTVLALTLVVATTWATARVTAAMDAAPGGPREQVGVRGHWVIEVRDPDGTVTSRREFHNALTADGRAALASYLNRAQAPGIWNIRFGGATSPCGTAAAATLDCFITEARSARQVTSNISKNLVIAGEPFRLNGSLTVPTAGSITSVATGSDACPPTTSVTTCQGNFILAGPNFPPPFTGTTVAAIPVSAGQLVAVGVTITFATAP
jgi:hypothetical protein